MHLIYQKVNVQVKLQLSSSFIVEPDVRRNELDPQRKKVVSHSLVESIEQLHLIRLILHKLVLGLENFLQKVIKRIIQTILEKVFMNQIVYRILDFKVFIVGNAIRHTRFLHLVASLL